MPEVWLRGPIEGVPRPLMPAVHALLQVREELEAAIPPLTHAQLWARPGGAASIGFHLKHLAGSLDRLITYAEGRQLDDRQRADLAAEAAESGEQPLELLALARRAIDDAVQRIRAMPVEQLDAPREVGRDRLPSTVLGLVFHAAEHAQRHAGQIATTVRVVRGGA